MIDESTALGARILERLRGDRVIWMTTVDRGAPQPAPVWFMYERDEGGERIIVYSKTDARRIANVMADPKVALNFNCTPGGGEVHVIRGSARIALERPQASESEAYLARYRDWIEEEQAWGGTFEGFAAQYSVPIEITELAVWGW
ncbi:MAG: TIGR03667 family PPOX class F420-dependent oxidoreductase [Candidatus Limnocylindrales bacterium]|jgi:PPOX class probable F420-dependent enzyme